MACLCALSLVLALRIGPAGTGHADCGAAAGETQEIVLLDGTRALGRVEEVREDVVTFRTTAGAAIQVTRSQIEAVTLVAGRLVDGTFWPADPNTTRLLFGPTARALKRGQTYFAVYEVTLPFVQVGLTDRLSIGAGTLPYFGAGTAHPFWVTPKVQVFSGAKTAVALGAIHFANFGDESLGVGYGVLTHGSADSAVTAGFGYGYASGKDSGGAPVVMVGGEHRIARRLKVVTENYAFRGGGFLSGGVRLLGEPYDGRLCDGRAARHREVRRLSTGQFRLDLLTTGAAARRPPCGAGRTLFVSRRYRPAGASGGSASGLEDDDAGAIEAVTRAARAPSSSSRTERARSTVANGFCRKRVPLPPGGWLTVSSA